MNLAESLEGVNAYILDPESIEGQGLILRYGVSLLCFRSQIRVDGTQECKHWQRSKHWR